MEEYRVEKLCLTNLNHHNITVHVPGSKSITNRALLLAALAQGESTLEGVLFSDDSRNFLKAVQQLGMGTKVNEQECEVSVSGHAGCLPEHEAEIFVGSAGTAARFLTAFLGLSEGTHRIDASAQMKNRPMGPLLKTLTDMGAEISFEEKEGYLPFTIKGAGLLGRKKTCKNVSVTVNIDDSSQFLSALLIALGSYEGESLINVEGSHGMAYIGMTVKMMEQFGIHAEKHGNTYSIKPQNGYTARKYEIEPDVSAACYFYAMAALLGISVQVFGVHEASLQGDVEFIHILKKMGCSYEDKKAGICVTGPADGKLKGICVDMHSCSDQAITLAAIASFANSPTTITGISHIRLQESNRIKAICTELTRMGIICIEHEDGLTIYPGKPKPACIETYDDHRMAMGFSLVGLRADQIVIKDPKCCRKTFENYFEVLESCIEKLR